MKDFSITISAEDENEIENEQEQDDEQIFIKRFIENSSQDLEDFIREYSAT